MKKEFKGSPGYLNYLKGIKKEAWHIHLLQVLFCIGFLILWELLASYGLICTLCQGQRKKTKQLEADFCILQESAYLNSIDI